MHCPKINANEALKDEVSHIVECMGNGKTSLSDGALGLKVVRILEAAQESIKNRGKEVML
jgi:predicted dehydrogenase